MGSLPPHYEALLSDTADAGDSVAFTLNTQSMSSCAGPAITFIHIMVP